MRVIISLQINLSMSNIGCQQNIIYIFFQMNLNPLHLANEKVLYEGCLLPCE